MCDHQPDFIHVRRNHDAQTVRLLAAFARNQVAHGVCVDLISAALDFLQNRSANELLLT